MHIILRYPDGTRVAAILLSRGDTTLRIAVPGRNDAIELRAAGARWVDDDGEKVSIEAMVFDARGERAAASGGAMP